MKYSLSLLMAVVLVGLFSFAPADEQLLSTKLRITVIDGLGNPVEGATVTLYTDEDDYRSNTNAIESSRTDEKGRVTFKDLKPVSYLLDARKGDMNNNGEGVKTAPLEEGRLNKVNTVIE